MENPLKIDENQGYPHFRKPPSLDENSPLFINVDHWLAEKRSLSGKRKKKIAFQNNEEKPSDEGQASPVSCDTRIEGDAHQRGPRELRLVYIPLAYVHVVQV